MLLQNKVIVITGAGNGLGKALAKMLISKKANLVLCDKNEKALQIVAEETHPTSVLIDTTNKKDIDKLVEMALDKFGKIDIWINNAGVWLPRMNIEEVSTERAHNLIEVNFFGTLNGVVSAIKQMKTQGDGTIVNIVSTSALTGRPQSAIYASSKHAVKGLTDSIREELKDFKIKVIGIYPGGIKTNLFEEKRPEDFDEYMTPEFVAEKIVTNLEKNNPDEELIIKREGQE